VVAHAISSEAGTDSPAPLSRSRSTMVPCAATALPASPLDGLGGQRHEGQCEQPTAQDMGEPVHAQVDPAQADASAQATSAASTIRRPEAPRAYEAAMHTRPATSAEVVA